MRKVTAFSWGDSGWGNATRELLQATAVIERDRGFEPPLFVDIRAKRSVRAEGFRDDAFERLARKRYRWMPGLGNAAILGRSRKMSLVQPADVYELLGLILAQQKQNRRVVFFCSCRSPFEAATCHRHVVDRELRRAARQLGVELEVQEWPGGLPKKATTRIRVTTSVIDSVRRGASNVRLGRTRPPPTVLGLPHGSFLELKSGTDRLIVSVAAPALIAGQWVSAVFDRVKPSRRASSRNEKIS